MLFKAAIPTPNDEMTAKHLEVVERDIKDVLNAPEYTFKVDDNALGAAAVPAWHLSCPGAPRRGRCAPSARSGERGGRGRALTHLQPRCEPTQARGATLTTPTQPLRTRLAIIVPPRDAAGTSGAAAGICMATPGRMGVLREVCA